MCPRAMLLIVISSNLDVNFYSNHVPTRDIGCAILATRVVRRLGLARWLSMAPAGTNSGPFGALIIHAGPQGPLCIRGL